jgi:hypothetical protein
MKTLCAILIALCGIGVAAADDSLTDLEPTPLPAGPILRRAADFSQWQIDFTYQKKSDAPAGADPSVPAGALAKSADADLPERVTVTRTRPRWHSALVLGSGRKRELWFDGAMRYEVGPEPTTITPIAAFNPGYNPPFLEYSNHDFPDVEWVSFKTYLGMQKGTNFWVFQEGPGGPIVWIDSTMRRPVIWKNSEETRTFSFLAAPTELLVLPDTIARLSEGFKRLQDLSSQVPPHR